MNLKNHVLAFVVIANSCNCSPASNTSKEKYFGDVGYIKFNPQIDSASYKPCRNDIVPIYQNGNIYKGEKIALISEFAQIFDTTYLSSKNDGYITLRFVVNCNKEVGMIRTEAFSFDYEAQNIEEELLLKLKKALVSLKNWPKIEDGNGNAFDYYLYLTLKISNGKIETILP